MMINIIMVKVMHKIGRCTIWSGYGPYKRRKRCSCGSELYPPAQWWCFDATMMRNYRRECKDSGAKISAWRRTLCSLAVIFYEYVVYLIYAQINTYIVHARSTIKKLWPRACQAGFSRFVLTSSSGNLYRLERTNIFMLVHFSLLSFTDSKCHLSDARLLRSDVRHTHFSLEICIYSSTLEV